MLFQEPKPPIIKCLQIKLTIKLKILRKFCKLSQIVKLNSECCDTVAAYIYLSKHYSLPVINQTA